MKHKDKRIPRFRSEDEEREFWSRHDSSEYIDWHQAKRVGFPSLKPSLKSISIRLPESMIEELKVEFDGVGERAAYAAHDQYGWSQNGNCCPGFH